MLDARAHATRAWRCAALLGLLGLACCAGESAPKRSACGSACEPAFAALDLIAGRPGGGGWVDGAGAVAHFSQPFTFARDGSRLFLSDECTIRTVDAASAEVGTLAGTYGVIGGADGVGSAASFYQPGGLVASDGALYLTDTENHTVRKIDLASGEVSTIAGSLGVNGTNDGVGADARFREPEGLAIDDTGHVLYVADTDNNTLRRMDLITGEVSTIAGDPGGVVDDVDGPGAAARFATPKALVFGRAGELYVADSGNTSLRKVALDDDRVSTVARFDVAPAGFARLGDSLLMTLEQSIVQLDLATLQVSPVAGDAKQPGFVDGTGSEARFSAPAGLVLDGDGNLFVADQGNYAVRKVELASGSVSTFAGAESIGSADGTGDEARFRSPQGLVVDGDTAYVADTNNNTLRKVVISSGEVTTLAGAAGEAGSADGAASEARFNQPYGLALDARANTLYVADAGNRALRKMDLATGVVTSLQLTAASGLGLMHPEGLTKDDERLFIADSGSHCVLALDLRSSELSVLAGAAGIAGGTDGRGAEARFNQPNGLALDGHGGLFVADVLNHTIRKIAIATGEVTTVAGARGLRGADDWPQLSNQTIHPFTDLLLHDMGPDLADGRPDFEASGSEWRTPPLWGIGLIQAINDHTFLLHDGRARGFAEAILWHGGEAEAAREAFRTLDKHDRDDLAAFLGSL